MPVAISYLYKRGEAGRRGCSVAVWCPELASSALLSGSRTLPSGLRAHTYPRASTLTHAPGLVLWSGKDRVVTSVRRGERGIEASRGGINATSTHRCHADMETAMRPGP